MPSKSADDASRFFEELIERAPFRVHKVPTDNGKEFTDRFCATGERKPTGKHPFDVVYAEHGVEHRLIRPRRPQTNGMVERFNGRIEEVMRQTRLRSARELRDTLHKYYRVYNHHIPPAQPGAYHACRGVEILAEKETESLQKNGMQTDET